ncbi:MAG: hypothetical protein ABIM99_03735 [Candidatus Dojkabacteria bacterium]
MEVKETSLEKPEVTYFEGILYHGAKKELTFSKDFDYSDPNSSFDGSFTLGEGMYLTDNRELAKSYSNVRQHNSGQHLVYSAHAPNCKFLDFRGEHGNVPVEGQMLIDWERTYSDYLNKLELEEPISEEEYEDVVINGRTRRKFNRALLEREDLRVYGKYLKALAVGNIKVDLRVMLGSAPGGDLPKNDSGYEGGDYAPPWSSLFRRFIIGQSYDGIIYNEEGEGKDDGNHPTYVVYKLEAIEFSTETIDSK